MTPKQTGFPGRCPRQCRAAPRSSTSSLARRVSRARRTARPCAQSIPWNSSARPPTPSAPASRTSTCTSRLKESEPLPSVAVDQRIARVPRQPPEQRGHLHARRRPGTTLSADPGPGGRVLLTVADTGVGIPVEYQCMSSIASAPRPATRRAPAWAWPSPRRSSPPTAGTSTARASREGDHLPHHPPRERGEMINAHGKRWLVRVYVNWTSRASRPATDARTPREETP